MLESILKFRTWIIVLTQVLIVVAAFALAFALRFDMNIPPRYASAFWAYLPALLIIKLVVFWKMGLFQGWWKYVSFADLVTLLKANLLAVVVFLVFTGFAQRMESLPRSVLVLDGVFCFILMGGVRFLARGMRENYFGMSTLGSRRGNRVLIYGAGEAGQAIVRQIRHNSNLEFAVVGYVDDDEKKRKQFFQGVPVLGKGDDLARLVQLHEVDEMIVAIPSASRRELQKIAESGLEAGVKCRTLPSIGELITGEVSIQQVKDVDVQDILGREEVQLAPEKIFALLKGKKVLVTGAAGSIGSELCRQVGRFGPSELIFLDSAESPLFQIDRELAGSFPEMHREAFLCDIRNRTKIRHLFERIGPDVVFHAAAYKHVPIMEANPAEAVDNNVRGTKILVDAARDFGCSTFVLISTDKAVNPSSIMGATKRAAEMYVQSVSTTREQAFLAVRFGNVLESAGSVVPIFKDQIKKGGPVLVTHPEVSRYFMTIPEATQLVLQAASLGKGGEIFILDMGDPVKILDLAEKMIRLSGFVPYEDVDIAFSGLRPGEKLNEELYNNFEAQVRTSHQKISIISSTGKIANDFHGQFEDLYELVRHGSSDEIFVKMAEIVPEYCCQSKIKQSE